MPNSFPILVNTGGASRTTAKLMKTGQITSYRTGDDGDIEAGREVDFFTLAENNPFGNTNRFTDELGGQVYANNIFIDWSGFDGSTVLGFYNGAGAMNTNRLWDDGIDWAAGLTVATYTDWRISNIDELESLRNKSLSSMLNYFPVNKNGLNNIWSSTTDPADTARAFYLTTIQKEGTAIKTSSSFRVMPVRNFTVTGTTLT